MDTLRARLGLTRGPTFLISGTIPQAHLLLMSLICGEGVFVKLFADQIGQVADISNGTHPHVDAREHIGDSSVRF